MTRSQPFLAVPIRAQISADGVLLSADPPIWRLHSFAGGVEGGAAAVPGFAALAALCLRTHMRIERPVRAVDADNDVELWVEATPKGEVAELLITGWRDIEQPDASLHHRMDTVRVETETDHLLIDSDHRIVRLPGFLPSHAIGKHFGSVFVVDADANGTIPIIEALSEHKGIEHQNVGVIGERGRFLLSLIPQFDPDRRYIGHAGTLVAEREKALPSNDGGATAAHVESPFNRQFASVLKQPLSRIVANAETIGSRLYGPLRDNYAEYAQDIANAARHLTELVADMEDLEAIDRPGFSVARDRIELGDIARRVGGLLALKASDHGINLVLPDASENVTAIGEFRRVLQILLNLVGNAIRYAPDGSVVTVSVEKAGETAVVRVGDEGDGVAVEDRERIFEKFERLGRSGDGGSGLGLYISRKLARAMGGELNVTEAPGGGALFQLSLPAR